MCDGRSFASSPVAAWRVEAFFFCGVLFVWPLQVAIYLCRCQLLNDHVLDDRKTNQIQCNRPYDTATCYLHTAIWLGRCQSVLTQIERTSERDIVCHRVSPFQPYDMLACGT